MIVCAVFMTHLSVSEPSDDEDEVSESKNKIKMIF